MPETTHTAARGGSPAEAPAVRVSHHRWPWRFHELRAIAVLATVCLALGLLGGSRSGGMVAIAWYAAGVLGAAATTAWLHRVGTKRKDLSSFDVEVHGERIVVRSRGPLQTSAVRHHEATVVGYRRFGSDETFVVSDGTQAARVPVRATVDPAVREALDVAFARAPRIDAEARDLYERRPEPGAVIR